MFIDSVKANLDYCNVSLSEVICQITSKDISFDLIEEDSNRSIISIHSPDLVNMTIYYNTDNDNVVKKLLIQAVKILKRDIRKVIKKSILRVRIVTDTE